MRQSLNSVTAWLAEAPWLNRKRLLVYPKIFLVAYVLTFTGWVMTLHGMVSREGKPIGVDFASFYAASATSLGGEPSAAYDLERHQALEDQAIGQPTFLNPFVYPPTFLLIVLPAALLGYLWALGVWTMLTFAGYSLVLRKIIPRTETFWPALAFPGAFANLENGQNGLLTFSLLGGALLSLESRPLLAGALLGLLTYKPQMGLLVPLVLVVTGRWRAFFAAVLTAVAFAGISLAMLGAETWRAFFNSREFLQRVFENRGVEFYTMQSVFAAVRLLGGGIAAAYLAQFVAAAIAAAIVLWIWRQNIQFELKASALVTGMVLVTPYIIYYDLVLLALPIAWLTLEGRRSGFLPFEKSLLAVAWVLPLLCEYVARVTFVPLTPLVCGLLLAFIIRRAKLAAFAHAARMTSEASY